MVLGMPVTVWIPWVIGFAALCFCWWLGIVYWGNELKNKDRSK
jgi:hypothetical protein